MKPAHKLPKPRLHARRISAGGKSTYMGGGPGKFKSGAHMGGPTGGMAFAPPPDGSAFQGANAMPAPGGASAGMGGGDGGL